VIEAAEARGPSLPARLTPMPTGFEPLDAVLGGGLHNEDLVLVGGRPGVGKTVAMLQMARHVARAGTPSVYVCYEHGEEALVARLLALELGELAYPEDVPSLDKLKRMAWEVTLGVGTLRDFHDASRLSAEATDRFTSYAHRLQLVRASGGTGVDELRRMTPAGDGGWVLFVDYLQKVAGSNGAVDEDERVTQVVSGLKELALERHTAVVAAVAADHDGLVARRLHLHHLRCAAALAHEADIVLTLNEKWSAVSKTHLAYDASRARTYRQWVVWSVEKHRDGPAGIDVEFRKDFASYRFDPHGRFVSEQLVDDVLFVE
jgi:replicative DNA helicase